MKDLNTISTDLFNKVRSRFSNVKLGDQAGAVITDPATARFFDLDFTHEGASLGHVNIKLDDDRLTVIYNESMVEGQNIDAKNDWYKFLKELRMFARSNMLNFDTRDITKTNLDQRDFEYLAQENGDTKMSESKLWGTSKTSFQEMGEAKIIVRHSQPVNYNIPAGRTMHIDSIYIENAAGERFRYPHRHLNGARAMATHVANGGTVYDAIGSHISSLSEELSKLRQFKNYTQRNGLQEALSDVSELVLTRISDIKEQISKLQRQNYYADFAESFSPATEMPIPEETVNSWVDALTIRTFNEELKSVFPFIYRLVDQPTSLGYDDLVGEATEEFCDACDKPKKECVCDEEELEEHNHLEGFEQHLDSITSFDYDVQEGDDEKSDEPAKTDSIEINGREVDTHTLEIDNIDRRDHPDYVDAYFSAGSFKDGDALSDEELDELKDQYPDMFYDKINDYIYEADQVQQPSQNSGAREVVEFIMSMYDQQQGTFPKGEEGVKIAVEKRCGDHAGQFASQVVERLSAKDQLS
jgi:hypothetical protein